MNVFENKCLFHQTDSDNQEIILLYNTREPMYDSKRFSKVIPCQYDVVVTLDSGEQLDEQTLVDDGILRFFIEKAQTVQFCFSVSKKQENYKELLKQLKRAGKKVDLRLASQWDLDRENAQISADERIQTAMRLANKAKAIKSLQTGRKNVRGKIEKRLNGMSGHYIVVTLLQVTSFLSMSLINQYYVKQFMKEKKLQGYQ